VPGELSFSGVGGRDRGGVHQIPPHEWEGLPRERLEAERCRKAGTSQEASTPPDRQPREGAAAETRVVRRYK
jgi:hypothetical protein